MKFLPLKGNKINIQFVFFRTTRRGDWIISNHRSDCVNMTQLFSHPLISAFSTAHTENVCLLYFIYIQFIIQHHSSK